MLRIESGDITQGFDFQGVQASDHLSPATGLSAFTVYRKRGTGGTWTVMTTPTITEGDATHAPGFYALLCDEDMAITAGKMTEVMSYKITCATMDPVSFSIELYIQPLIKLLARDRAAHLNETGRSEEIRVINAKTGAGVTGLVAANFTAAYALNNAAGTTFALSNLAGIGSAFSGGGIKEKDATNFPGDYRVDIPDALFASAVGRGIVKYISTGNATSELDFDIYTEDPFAASAAATQTSVNTLLASNEIYIKNTAYPHFIFFMRKTDGTGGSAMTVTAQLTKDGAALAAIAGAVVEIGGGYYYVPLTSGEMNADEVGLLFTAVGCLPTAGKIKTQS